MDFDLEEWLVRQKSDVLYALIARSALRFIPLIDSIITNNSQLPRAELIRMFRAIAEVLCKIQWPETAVNVSGYRELIKIIRKLDKYAFAASPTYNAIESFELSLLQLSGGNKRLAVKNYIIATNRFEKVLESSKQATQLDIDFLLRENNVINLLNFSLWGGYYPSSMQSRWNAIKQVLLNDDPNWQVWTQWYDKLVVGNHHFIKEIEIGSPINGEFGRISFPPHWYNNPKKLNASLQEIIDQYWAKELKQDSRAEIFEVNEDGKIVSASQSKGLGLTTNPEQKDWYSELREAVAAALLKSPNELGAAKGPLEKLSDALPEKISEARVPRLWRRANNLRRTLAKHERAKASNDEFQFDKLPDDIADDLEDIVGSYNNLLIGDQGLSQADIDARSPAETQDIIESFKIIDPAIEMAINDNIAIGDASEVLSDLLDNPKDEVGIQNQIMGRMQIEQDHKTRLNFARVMVKSARDMARLSETASHHFVTRAGPAMAMGDLIIYKGAHILPFVAAWLGAGVVNLFLKSLKTIEDNSQK